MIRSAVTISLVPEARGGPFVFWDDLAAGCRKAAAAGIRRGRDLPAGAGGGRRRRTLRRLLDRHRLKLAAVGTGAGWVKHKLHADHARRRPSGARRGSSSARSSTLAGQLGAPAIIGSMQGRWGDELTASRRDWHIWPKRSNDLGEHAGQYGVPLIYEPLNRYETNIANTVGRRRRNCCESLKTDNVKLLADLFHMNIEEADIAAAIRGRGGHIGHVHFADSNRRPAGLRAHGFRPDRRRPARDRLRRLRLRRGLPLSRPRRRGEADDRGVPAIFSRGVASG